MIRKFSSPVVSGQRDSFWSEVAWKTQATLDACLQSARQGGQPVKIVA